MSEVLKDGSNLSLRESSKLVSVLFAVYGIPERILRAGLECLKSQKLMSAEFLLINDKSPDAYTLGVLQEYVNADTRFRLIDNQENLGLARVRNLAIEESSGKYFTMFDPDDLIPDNYLQILVDNAEYYDADMVTCQIKEFEDGEEIKLANNFKSEDFYRLKRPLKTRRMYRQMFVCRLFKLSTIGDLRFEPKLTRGSDLLFIHQYLVRCEKTIDINFPAYFYRHGRIFAHGEKAIPPRPKSQLDNVFFEKHIITMDGFYNLIASCKTDSEREFVSYMLIRRYLRNVFGARREGHEEYKYQVYRKYYLEKIAEPLKLYGFFAKLTDKLFMPETECKGFYKKLNIVRLIFELMHLPYHIRKSCHKLKIKIFKVA